MAWIQKLGNAPFSCPVELTQEVLGGKWSAVLLAHLKEQPHRYSDLRRKAPALSDKVLTQRLRELQDKGLVDHVTEASPTPHYALTARGRSLGVVLEAMFQWGSTLAGEIGMSFPPVDGP